MKIDVLFNGVGNGIKRTGARNIPHQTNFFSAQRDIISVIKINDYIPFCSFNPSTFNLIPTPMILINLIVRRFTCTRKMCESISKGPGKGIVGETDIPDPLVSVRENRMSDGLNFQACT